VKASGRVRVWLASKVVSRFAREILAAFSVGEGSLKMCSEQGI